MKYLIALFFIVFLTGCSVKYSNKAIEKVSNKQNIQELYQAIRDLNSNIDNKEALSVATIAYEYPLFLANEYQLVSPPLWHNTLINMNLKKRGFCYHFAQDLLKELNKQNIQSMDLQWVTHKKSNYWEHNAVLITAKKQHYSKGIVLDPWRNSGKLFWSRIKEDTQYNWKFDHQKSRYYGNTRR